MGFFHKQAAHVRKVKKQKFETEDPVPFDTFEDAFKRALTFEDRVDAIQDLKDCLKPTFR